MLLSSHIAAGLCLLASIAGCAAAQTSEHAIIVGYVFPQDTHLQPGQIDAAHLNRINYAFANIDHGRLVQGFAADNVNLAMLTTLRKQHPSLSILISVGGWTWSTHFSEVALTAASRKIFVDSAMDFVVQHDLDGLDVDWEYPGLPGIGNPFRVEDTKDYTLLLRDLRLGLDTTEKRMHRHLFLTVAAGASPEFLAHTEMRVAQQYLDTVNLMSYDYATPAADPMTGHNAPLHASPSDPASGSADASVRAFEQAGVPAAKLLLGIPFYGHAWNHVPNVNHGLDQPGKPAPENWAPYGQIASKILQPGAGDYVRFWDEAASVPYLYSAAKQTFISYEDPQSIAIKCQYVKSHHLGGVMFWEYTNDPSGTLLKTIDQTLY